MMLLKLPSVAATALASLVLLQDAPLFAFAIDATTVDRYDYSETFSVDDDCNYRLEFTMRHDESLPLGDATSCDPANGVAIADDGIPYLGSREAITEFPDNVKAATGIDHLSIDWNSCGHPPFGSFNKPHYDFHMYLQSLEYRESMTCDLIPGAPVCDPAPGAQNTTSGQAFFDVAVIDDGPDSGKLANMPESFKDQIGSKLPHMGGHAWDISSIPTVAEWVDPVWMIGPYDGGVVHFEPMVPHEFVTGSTSRSHEESLAYVGQTISALPKTYSVSYDGSTGYTTVTLKGKSNVCNSNDDTEAAENEEDAATPDEDELDEEDNEDPESSAYESSKFTWSHVHAALFFLFAAIFV